MARQQTRRRIELGWFEAVVLAIGYVASLGIVGLGGFLVGQRTVPEHLGREERLLRLPISASGGGAGRDLGDAEPEMTFYDKLMETDGPVREGRIIMPEQEPEREPEKPPQRVPETVDARLPKPQDAESGGAAAVPGGAPRTEGRQAEPTPARPLPEARLGVLEPAAPASRESAERVTAEAAATAQALRDEAPTAAPLRQGQRSQTLEATPAVARVPSPPSGVTPEAAATVHLPGSAKPLAAPAEVPKGAWSVQVNATKEEEVARSLAKRLRERGYDAFIVEQSREGATWYRVRVGRLQSIEMANELVSKIKEREGLPHAFVASD